jgi:hypothetical protein
MSLNPKNYDPPQIFQEFDKVQRVNVAIHDPTHGLVRWLNSGVNMAVENVLIFDSRK